MFVSIQVFWEDQHVASQGATSRSRLLCSTDGLFSVTVARADLRCCDGLSTMCWCQVHRRKKSSSFVLKEYQDLKKTTLATEIEVHKLMRCLVLL